MLHVHRAIRTLPLYPSRGEHRSMSPNYQLCTGMIPGLRLPFAAWKVLRRESITTLSQLEAAADELEAMPGIGPHSALAIRRELTRAEAERALHDRSLPPRNAPASADV
jgi:hypothetical protein